jgi:hypothetical protein
MQEAVVGIPSVTAAARARVERPANDEESRLDLIRAAGDHQRHRENHRAATIERIEFLVW